ncbi:MAG TPA: sulfotransferase [Actinomycetota bacterium]|nr:sulfotransferase [Actinomycetota bacterium]
MERDRRRFPRVVDWAIAALKNELPTRFHIGTQRAGSSYIYNLLNSHPNVALNAAQEVHFYTSMFERGVEWYCAGFPQEGVRIDTSPKYFMLGEMAAPRIRETLPNPSDALFVVVFRDPVDYLFSHFRLQLRQGYFDRNRDLYPKRSSSLVEFATLYPDYLERARYAQTLKRQWLSRFARDQFKVIVFERFIRNEAEAMQEVLDFFGLPRADLSAATSSQNKTLRHPALYAIRERVVKVPWLKNAIKRNRIFNRVYADHLTDRDASLTEEERSSLAARLSDDVGELRELLDDPIDEWREFGH